MQLRHSGTRDGGTDESAGRRATEIGCEARPLAAALTAATCALLGPGAPSVVAAQELAPLDVDTALLYYGEADGRVQDLSFNATLRKELKEESFLSLKLAVDTLTGASPNGAVPSTRVQTFTRPSGKDRYSVAPGEHPLDDTFHDSRTALDASWQQPLGRLALLDVGLGFSTEYDYEHAGVNARIARDFNKRNTTLSAGIAYGRDNVDPVGGSPIGLAPMLEVGNASNKLGGRSKDVTDFLLGVTQVIDRHTLVQLNYSLSRSDGYLSDPYKVLSVVDPTTAEPVAGPAGSGLNLYLYEKRPDAREKQSVYALVKRDVGGDVLDVSFRYMTDDWGIDSETVELRYRFNLRADKYLQPHVRFYSQSAADFYHTLLFAGRPVPDFASADYRLGEFDAVTMGIKLGMKTRRGEMSTRLELYRQSGTPEPGTAVGVLAGLDLNPDLRAVIAQFTYRFGR
ncbi:MAG TPA: DUF3570 domain-containing protein [Gammaproteobacteria bacterium]|nr:DUF3570 domain-containing protein [Gammaproteobacteria bacterium]